MPSGKNGRAVGRNRGLEHNDILTRLGVTEPFPGQAFDRPGVLHGVEGCFQFPGPFRFHSNLLVKIEFAGAQPLVLLEHRLKAKGDREDGRDHEQTQHEAGELVPDVH